ncbi:preprotein translocase subunit SecY [Candidatus Wolfebacteria bacterium RIFCSPHIGHO2_01_FULL_48_22]|uniref:Protein translocase subunit SecY n=2 Tax=Candidatus Wolfeibacteriota TaxID=1752735 RepID=A0A1F8DT21_9BACT|nr:MAG: preprotein translocase subunit SecY [Candidatus Wolfebacteria bacterium RIFCSPHIGHO2_01_FULL_48_22]OGM92007.1 MAG: preprotein translocase subunit SecY [Candidatus Wolfebacteria bacterium RIFCSPLOWO2_01_FULL_47_17b]
MSKFLQIFKIEDLRKRIFIVLGLLIVFRIMAAIPIPDVDTSQLQGFFAGNQLFGFFNIFSGGGLSNLSIAMLGVGPYITATIIMQLLTMIFPRLKQMYYEEGSAGRAKFSRWSKYLTVPLAFLSGYGFLQLLISQQVIPNVGFAQLAGDTIIITAGSMILVWIGDLITEKKIGNGVSLIIFAGIVASIPGTIQNAIATFDPTVLTTYIAFIAIAVVVIAGVVFVNEAERKVPITYAKRVRGNKMYGGVSSYLPLKVNQAGVIPIIFAISVLLFPQFFAQAIAFFSSDLSKTLNDFVQDIFNNQYIYAAAYFVLVVVFTYFYTAITFDPKEISKNLQRSGGVVLGIRPGEQTAGYLSKIITRITLWGALFLGFIAILPNITTIVTGITFLSLGGTALLIVVSVALEVLRQINSQLIMREYEGFE